MRLIDADRLLSEKMKSKYYHLPNGDIAIPLIDIEHAPTIEERKTGRWILVSERFPEEGEEVLVYLFDGKSPYLAWIQDGLWRTEEFVIDVDEEPVAWMPLPEPYRKDGEQDG